ncbi:MAG TPA: GNAT family N-acetyltransferase [Nitrosospira sp.]|nr:GNAT family N-acetyltransferase [Nitrosospira sp.]
MNNDLISLLRANLGAVLSAELAADICMAASAVPRLIPAEAIDGLRSREHDGFAFGVERIEDIAAEMKPLHRAHWNETESHRHGLELNPDYEAFTRYERSGRYLLFTLRKDGRLLGNCAIYLDRSAHTQTLIATEDTLYLLPEARRGRVARRFVAYVEDALRELGVREIHITVKTVNRAGRFLQMLGYRHVENGLMKILEVDNV